MAGSQTEDQTQVANFIAFEIPGEAVAFARAGKNGKRTTRRPSRRGSWTRFAPARIRRWPERRR